MATKKQIAVTADQLGRALNYLDNLSVDYAIVIRGTPVIFSNVCPRFAATILRDKLELSEKIHEEKIQAKAERMPAIPDSE